MVKERGTVGDKKEGTRASCSWEVKAHMWCYRINFYNNFNGDKIAKIHTGETPHEKVSNICSLNISLITSGIASILGHQNVCLPINCIFY